MWQRPVDCGSVDVGCGDAEFNPSYTTKRILVDTLSIHGICFWKAYYGVS